MGLLGTSVRPSLLWNSAEVGVMLRRARKWRSGKFPVAVREQLTTATWGRKGFPDSGAAFTVGEGTAMEEAVSLSPHRGPRMLASCFPFYSV